MLKPFKRAFNDNRTVNPTLGTRGFFLPLFGRRHERRKTLSSAFERLTLKTRNRKQRMKSLRLAPRVVGVKGSLGRQEDKRTETSTGKNLCEIHVFELYTNENKHINKDPPFMNDQR